MLHHGLKLWREQIWCVHELNEEYIANMVYVPETYRRPYDAKQPAISLNEKPVTLHADVRPASSAVPGHEPRSDNEYQRRGTANVFCAVEPNVGRHFTFPTPDRSAFQFGPAPFHLALQYPEVETIHPVINNLNIDRRKSLTEYTARKSAAKSGTCAPFTTRQLTEAGSIRQKSKSASSRASASLPEESQT
jgi:hypothetical protein